MIQSADGIDIGEEIRLLRLEIQELKLLVSEDRPKKEFYTVAEAAKAVNRAPFTVRSWCREGRLEASKRDVGHGLEREWIIHVDEIARYMEEGLL